MFTLLITFAELVLPAIFVMADKPDQIPPDFSYMNILPQVSRISRFNYTHLSFFFLT